MQFVPAQDSFCPVVNLIFGVNVLLAYTLVQKVSDHIRFWSMQTVVVQMKTGHPRKHSKSGFIAPVPFWAACE